MRSHRGLRGRTGRIPWKAAGALVTLGALAIACSGGDDGGQAGDDTEADLASADEVYASTHPDAENLEIVEPPDQPGVEYLDLRYGPLDVQPGQNNIDFSDFAESVPKPEEDGYIVSIQPDLELDDGSVPPVDEIHLHHGVWINRPAERDPGTDVGFSGFGELFFAAGEEKTRMMLPEGFGYEYDADDQWVINYMVHNILPDPQEVWITYRLGFIPKSSPEAEDITPARPLWMDVQSGNIYPVFDVLQGTGEDGEFTYPDDADDPYGGGRQLNEWTVDRDSVLIGTGGHLHPGGHHVDLWLNREGTTPAEGAAPEGSNGSAHIFQSDAVYYEPAGAVSWDVSMTVTPPDWRIAVKEGDVLSISTTYDSERASWYEAMGIAIVWMTDGTDGIDPFEEALDPQESVLTHGHLAENDDHGGEETDEFVPNPAELPSGERASEINIADFTYGPGDIGGMFETVPVVEAGEELTFYNQEADATENGIWHTVTACAPPCNGRTGVAYPLADAEIQFDSGELGMAGAPTADRLEWTIPDTLPPGTYTYFCRIHPDMRGAFRVVE